MSRELKIAAIMLSMLFAVCCVRVESAGADAPGLVSSRRLEQRMNEIIALQQKIDRRTALAQEIHSRLKDQFALVRAEIRDELRQRRIDSYAQAVRWQALDHHLSLAQQLFSYMDALDRRVRGLKNDYQRLGFFYQEAVDDLKVIRTLPSLNITAFMADTSRVIEKSRHNLNQYLVDDHDVVHVRTPKIWHLVIEGKAGVSHAGPG